MFARSYRESKNVQALNIVDDFVPLLGPHRGVGELGEDTGDSDVVPT